MADPATVRDRLGGGRPHGTWWQLLHGNHNACLLCKERTMYAFTSSACGWHAAASSLASRRGSTASDVEVPTMIRSSSLIMRRNFTMLNPLKAHTAPRTTTTKKMHVVQKAIIRNPRLASVPPPPLSRIQDSPRLSSY